MDGRRGENAYSEDMKIKIKVNPRLEDNNIVRISGGGASFRESVSEKSVSQKLSSLSPAFFLPIKFKEYETEKRVLDNCPHECRGMLDKFVINGISKSATSNQE